MFCELFGYSKQAYYKHRKHGISSETQSLKIKELVLNIRSKLPRVGTRKLHYMLKESLSRENITIGRDGLFRLLRSEGLLLERMKRYTVTTNSKHWLRKYPNTTKGIIPSRPEEVWVADITYIDTLDGFRYLHLITDAYSKQIMGFEFSNSMEAVYTNQALEMALGQRKYPEHNLIHHSDRGLQYCSKLYTTTLEKHGVSISMTENGDPYENAVAERVNGILKSEFGLSERFEDEAQCRRQIKESITLYNSLRPHLSCHMLTPVQMHQQQEINLKSWKKNTPTKMIVG